jgi:hypothetical protein
MPKLSALRLLSLIFLQKYIQLVNQLVKNIFTDSAQHCSGVASTIFPWIHTSLLLFAYLEQQYFLQIDLKDLKLNKEGSEGRKTLVVRNLIRHS